MTRPPCLTPRPRPPLWAASLLVLALQLAAPAPAPAAPPSGPALVAAERWWKPSKLFSGLNNRARVVQLCVVVMCLALFILIKKFSGEGAPRWRGGAGTREDVFNQPTTQPPDHLTTPHPGASEAGAPRCSR